VIAHYIGVTPTGEQQMNSKMVTVNGKTYQVCYIDGRALIKAMPSGAHITSEKTRAKILAAL
jgi:hypothetical protein